MKRVEEASEASARSPCRAPATVDVDQVHGAGAPGRAGRAWSRRRTRAGRPAGSACRRAGPAPPPAARRGAAPPARSARPARRCRSARRRRRPPSRTVMRRFSEASAMVAPPVQDFDGAFQTMVVSEASTSPAAFSRTMPSPQKQRTNSRPPSAPFTSQRARANSLAYVQSTTNAQPFGASQSDPRDVCATRPRRLPRWCRRRRAPTAQTLACPLQRRSRAPRARRRAAGPSPDTAAAREGRERHGRAARDVVLRHVPAAERPRDLVERAVLHGAAVEGHPRGAGKDVRIH